MRSHLQQFHCLLKLYKYKINIQPKYSIQDLSVISYIKSQTQFYEWKNYHYAYDIDRPTTGIAKDDIPSVLTHIIGVGLSRVF
jgi:hypothetical protein